MVRAGAGVVLWGMALTAAPLARAQQASGFVEVRGAYNVGVDGVPWQFVERARPTIEGKVHDRVMLAATAELHFVQGRDLGAEAERTLEDSANLLLEDLDMTFGDLCEWPEHENDALGIDDFTDYVSLDRLYADVYLPWLDIRVGRQALRWGSAQLINPTDPFPEVLFTEPWKPRSGVNAIRTTVPIQQHEIQTVIAANDSFTAVRAAARGTLNAAGTDFSLVGAYRQDANDGIIGVDVRGTFGVGFWLEAALHVGQGTWEELALGIDYSFPVLERFVIMGQYYRNGSGGLGIDDYDYTSRLSAGITLPDCGDFDLASTFGAELPTDGEANPFAPFTLGRDYLLLSAMIGWVPELSSNFVVLQNLNDGTGFFVPTVTTTPLGWLEVSLAAQVPYKMWGNGGEFKPPPEMLQYTVESPIPGMDPSTVDMSGLVGDATFTLWTRANF